MSGSGADYRCGACQGPVPAEQVRASPAHPFGETACQHCGARLARLDPVSWRGWLRASLTVLGVVGGGMAIRAWPDGTWWPYALMVALSVGMLVNLRFQRRAAERVLRPVMRY